MRKSWLPKDPAPEQVAQRVGIRSRENEFAAWSKVGGARFEKQSGVREVLDDFARHHNVEFFTKFHRLDVTDHHRGATVARVLNVLLRVINAHGP